MERRAPAFPTRRHLVAMFAVPVLLAAAALLAPAIHLAAATHSTVLLDGNRVDVTVADTALRRSWGLQGRTSLADGEGMLFDIDPPRNVTFALKTLSFPVDVVFVGSDGKVTAVSTLDGESPFATSPGKARWVVEVPGGWALARHVGAGSPLTGPGIP